MSDNTVLPINSFRDDFSRPISLEKFLLQVIRDLPFPQFFPPKDVYSRDPLRGPGAENSAILN